MVYRRNQPISTDDLSISAPLLQDNTNSGDDSFGIDHYNFSNLTLNNGKHNQVTTPVYVASPPTGLPPVTAANEPKIYAFQDTANVGVLNYSRGPSNSVPTPITHLHSPSTPLTIVASGSINILNFAGLSRAIGTIYSIQKVNTTAGATLWWVFWDGTSLMLFKPTSSGAINGQLLPDVSGTTLVLKNQSTTASAVDVYWTLQMDRMS